ncbi:hypothetical protein FHQ08_03530 [Lactobacillus sp. CC-MHH1034]|uniref:GH25 family lysozyme n=1 Tax=Agrilactobacillus fermenti TaxID=2586909 RepID=UPI001E4CD2BF|nr:GH25 family lysozyme [Agrilactobacillus fermenti]MCD2255787.1 hypothetical protein [Agrilactobacillus fermenti]
MAESFADVSSHNRADISYIADLGAKGVVVKATEGTTYQNEKALTQTQTGLKAGLQVHLYHYAQFQNYQQAINEANYFHNFAKELGFAGNCVMVADVEAPEIQYTDTWHNTDTFLKRLIELGWPKVALYSMASWFWASKLPTNYPLWVANYGVSQPGVDNAAAWQHTSNFNGLNLDMSYDFTGLFTTEQFGATSGNAASQVGQPVNPDDVITITAGDAVGFHADGNIIDGSFNMLQKGKQFKANGIKLIAGEPQYLIGADFYVPQSYTDQAGIITVRGPKDAGLRSVDENGNGWRLSEYYFKGQSQWKVLDTKLINDHLFYQISDLDYMDSDSTHGSGK